MIENSPIVEDTRRVRFIISAKFDHDISRYIAYLQSEASRRAEQSIQPTHCDQIQATDKITKGRSIAKSRKPRTELKLTVNNKLKCHDN